MVLRVCQTQFQVPHTHHVFILTTVTTAISTAQGRALRHKKV